MRGGAVFPVRLRYTKRGKVRFLGHRDLARAFERALRVEALPLAFSAGFTPHPKVSFGLALPTGYESDAEYIDVELTRPVDLDALPAALSAALPAGVDVIDAVGLVERAPALQEAVGAVTWRVEVTHADGSPVAGAVLGEAVAEALRRTALPVRRVRKGREVVDDVRPAVRRVDLLPRESQPEGAGREACEACEACEMELATRPRGVRPGELLAAVADVASVPGGLAEGRVLRTHQWIERDGARREPHDADVCSRVPQARAS